MGKPVRKPESGYVKKSQSNQTKTYIEGNTARQYQTAPRIQQEEPVRKRRPSASRKTRQNRAKAMQMNPAYVVFLTLAAAATLFVCVNYLQLQAANTAHRERVLALSSQLSSLKLANDTKYEETISSIDMEKIKDIAMNELGMVYATQGQIVDYDSQDSDYVRQYEDVPNSKQVN